MKKKANLTSAFFTGILFIIFSHPVDIFAASNLNGHTVGIDPGHQGPNVDMSALEPNGPGSSEQKAKATSGTQGVFSGLPEYQLNLDVSLKLQAILESRGYKVVLTRTDNDTAISNKERAEYASQQGADIYVRIHANGSDSPDSSGALTISPSSSNPYIPYLYEDSNYLSQCVLDSYCEATGFQNLDVMYSDTMTGINWSSVPVTIVEMGFMTNKQDDLMMSDDSFQNTMAEGIANGIDHYFGIETVDMQASTRSDEELEILLSQVYSLLPTDNGTWSVYICNLEKGTQAALKDHPMQAASLIKLFIMGSVYENYDALSQQYGAEALDENLTSMITVSDNDAANTLVNWLGSGDNATGMQIVNQFCQSRGYTETSMGRMLLASNEYGDNYTSVSDCGKFLREIYESCQGTTSWVSTLSYTKDMYELLKMQTRTNKIPADMPEEVRVANKTGELSDVENDAGIIYDTPGGTDLVICFMSEGLNDTAAAQTVIAQVSRTIYNYYNES